MCDSLKSMKNTIECKRDSLSGAPDGAGESHWERVSHTLKNFDDYSQINVSGISARIDLAVASRFLIFFPRNTTASYDHRDNISMRTIRCPGRLEKILYTKV